MAKSLVIVESPAKAATLGKFLGKDFTVMACYGHVRDLPRKGIAVDREHGYAPTYEILPGKERTVADLRRAAKGADTIYLAADPDREGEAICWHLQEILKPGSPKAKFHRAEFHEITKSAVTRAVQNPGVIDQNRVNAQQARRIIDRLVGYEVSDLLWSKLWRGLSAGRVQTVTLRIIVERESERERFVAVPYFSVPVTLKKGETAFPARVVLWKGEKLRFDGTDPRLATAADAEAARAHVEGAAFSVVKVDAKERKSSAPPPFTTSKLQQGAARVGFSVRRTMQIAQRLYEGKTIGDRGTIGLITYMRTDSTRSADEALVAVRDFIGRTYGPGALPEEARRFRQKKDAQDAHEAIRPTSLDLPPEAVARYLAPDEIKLYRLIWNRFVASQMSPSVSEVTSVDIEAIKGGVAAGLRASGTVLKDPGWLRVYEKEAEPETEEKDKAETDAESADGSGAAGEKVRLPALATGDALALVSAVTEGHETQPPPRFNEASLVKFLEENGIGRPSTYAEIMRKIEDREYVRKKDRRFTPTPLGRLVVDLMREGFDDFFQTEYTAKMEEELDEVEEGKLDWRKALAEFDGKFVKDRDMAKKKMVSVKAGLALAEVRKRFVDFKLTNDPGDTCPKSGHPLKLRMGKAGLFIACSGYPDCDFTQDIPEVEEDEIDATELEGQTCEECGSPMKLRTGRNGSAFLGCTAYPVCRNTVPVKVAGGKAEAKPDVPTGEACPNCASALVTRHGRFGDYVSCSNYPACRFKPPKPVTLTGVKCPVCKAGDILVRRGRFGPFYGCSNYPSCEKNFKARPVPKACPNCKASYLLVRDRKAGAFYVCETEGCGLDVPASDLDAFEPTTRIPEGALEAAIAEARVPAPVKGAKKRTAKPRPAAKEKSASPDGPPPSTARSPKKPARPRRAKK
ncbi:MAG: type I DNA topoisomerase [Acidobacteria bacterium]|nr:type I DNA topoisomerase [Acidobacteriota bacterium]